MQKRTRAIVVTTAMTLAGIALGATIASAASGAGHKNPALQSTSARYVFACVNPEGGIDYLEFRNPLPHQCWFAGESLWYWDAVPLAVPVPTPTPTPTSTPTPTATPGAPVISNVETTALAYQSKTAAVAITSTLTLSDTNASAMITGATVSITAGFSASSTDTLTFTNANGITGTYSASTGVLTLTGSASLAAYQAALRSVQFSTQDTAASPAARTVSFKVTDSTSATSNTATRTINVSAAST